MLFSTLYGSALDIELASADTTKLFTTAKRKLAVNNAQREFVKLTECLQRQGTIAIVSGTAEYDLEASLSAFTWLAKQGVEIKILEADGITYRYISGDDLPIRTIEYLNRTMPGWRSSSAGTPMAQYQRDDGGAVYLGFVPAPSVGTSETWTITVPYIALPTDMSLDDDVPFTVSANPKASLWPWHQALVHYAASQLEKLRKELQRSDLQSKIFAGYVADYLQRQRPKGGQQVTYTREYRQEARRSLSRGLDPDRDFA
jgi:hypothetical protein